MDSEIVLVINFSMVVWVAHDTPHLTLVADALRTMRIPFQLASELPGGADLTIGSLPVLVNRSGPGVQVWSQVSLDEESRRTYQSILLCHNASDTRLFLVHDHVMLAELLQSLVKANDSLSGGCHAIGACADLKSGKTPVEGGATITDL
jgi:hypothetical protein